MEETEKTAWSREQNEAIEAALEYGTDEVRMAFLKNPSFSAAQMHSVLDGIKDGLNEVQLKIMADPSFQPSQMDEIRKCFLEGLNEEAIRHIAKPGITAKQMSDLRHHSVMSLMKETPDIFRKDDIEKIVRISIQQKEYLEKSMTEIKSMHKFMLENISAGDSDYLKEELEQKKEELSELKAEIRELKERSDALASETEKWKQAAMQTRQDDGIISFDEILHECLHRPRRVKKGRIPEIVRFMSSGGFDESQLEQIRLGYENGLSMKEIRAYAKVGIEAGKMECMRKILISLKKGETK